MSGLEQELARDLFLDEDAGTRIRIHFLELRGKQIRDLLASYTGSNCADASVRIVDRPGVRGGVCFVGAQSVVADSECALLKVLEAAKHKRATHATERNFVSSRSHAVCQLTVFSANRPDCATESTAGEVGQLITLVDCAGTERNNDSLFHSAERQGESAEINASLFVLKEVIRKRNLLSSSRKSHFVVPYRQSNLTRILRQGLEHPNSHLAVIATVAPNATDTERKFFIAFCYFLRLCAAVPLNCRPDCFSTRRYNQYVGNSGNASGLYLPSGETGPGCHVSLAR